MPQLKICGITDAAFAVEAARRGIDYLGLIFAEGSPRRVTVEQARQIAAVVRGTSLAGRGVPDAPRLVGVFTTQDVGEIANIASAVGLDVVQLHGVYADADVVALKTKGYEVWRLFRRNPACEDAVLLDGRRGNTSGMADWSLVAPLKSAGWRVVLAGGISTSNVADAIRTGADVIDMSGSLETSPGVKSVALLDDLVAALPAEPEKDTSDTPSCIHASAHAII